MPRLVATPDARLTGGVDGVDPENCSTVEIKMRNDSGAGVEYGDPDSNIYVRMTRVQAWLQGILHFAARNRNRNRDRNSVPATDLPADAYYMMVGYRDGPIRTGMASISDARDRLDSLKEWVTKLCDTPAASADVERDRMFTLYKSATWTEHRVHPVELQNDGRAMHLKDSITKLGREMRAKHPKDAFLDARVPVDDNSTRFRPPAYTTFDTSDGVTRSVFQVADAVHVLCQQDHLRRRLHGVADAVTEEAESFLKTVALSCDPITRGALNEEVVWMRAMGGARPGDAKRAQGSTDPVGRRGTVDVATAEHGIKPVQIAALGETAKEPPMSRASRGVGVIAYDAIKYSIGLAL